MPLAVEVAGDPQDSGELVGTMSLRRRVAWLLLAAVAVEPIDALEAVVSAGLREGCVAGTNPFRSPFPSRSVTSSSPPEKSPLEPLSKYGRRRKKHRTDNAKWAGQRRAVKKLTPPKSTTIPKPLIES